MTLNTMAFMGYTARIDYDPRDGILVGRVLGIEDQISFHGESIKSLKKNFESAIRHYLADCKAQGRAPQKQPSGKVLLRMEPEVHAAISHAAAAKGESLNLWATKALAKAAARGS